MINNKDRSMWFGASDTSFICGNYDTKTFLKFWFIKLGFDENNFTNKFIETGNVYEHKIAILIEKELNLKLKKDKQYKIRMLKLRVNLDCENNNIPFEIKTTNKVWEDIPRNYWQQIQVQMFIKKVKFGYLCDYLVDENYYSNWFIDLQSDRLNIRKINYDNGFIQNEYLPRLKYLNSCLKNKSIPTNYGLIKYLGEKNE